MCPGRPSIIENASIFLSRSLTSRAPRPSPSKTHTAKADRLKEAKAEADREIAAFKATREEAYQRALAEVREVVRKGPCGVGW
jgi:hypothetical protein